MSDIEVDVDFAKQQVRRNCEDQFVVWCSSANKTGEWGYYANRTGGLVAGLAASGYEDVAAEYAWLPGWMYSRLCGE